MENQHEQFPADIAATYQVFTKSTTPADVLASFVKRYGCEPEKIFIYNNQLWAGPVPDAKN